uniref:3-hydroxy-3-methylglutaryl-coenzyme A reductase n=1 Tax=Lygus hesperus TaxID=30085 RepID=A0A0A9YZG2_LYGHE
MARAPAFQLKSAEQGGEILRWIDENVRELRKVFESTSKHAKLLRVVPFLVGRTLFLRLEASTGDAMGMNMVTKGSLEVANFVCKQFSVDLVTVSGNLCVDKKASFMNWIRGRGKYVVAECVLAESVVHRVLHTTPHSMERVHVAKNYIGSSVAGTVGGNNAHAANVVAAFFLATGQDMAQVVESSHCLTQIQRLTSTVDRKGTTDSLYCSVTLPCIEVGTVGGGTGLAPQNACIQMILQQYRNAGANGQLSDSQILASVLAATVLAGEVNLIAALSSNELVSAHMQLNRGTTS